MRCGAPSEYLVPIGVSITPGTAGGRGSVGPLAELTGCRHWGALGPAILQFHREHMARTSTGAGRKSLEGFGPCRKFSVRPSWVRTGLPSLSSEVVTLSHQQMDQFTLPILPLVSPHHPVPHRGTLEVSTEEPGQSSPGSTYQGLSSKASTPVSIRLPQHPEKLLNIGELREWKYYPNLLGHDENPHIQIMPKCLLG